MLPIHPALVHFPIAFLSLAAVLRLWLLRSNATWVHATARLCLWLGTVSLGAAVLSGQATLPSAVPAEAAVTLELHRQFGFALLLWYGGLSLWELVRMNTILPGERFALAFAHIAGTTVLFLTAFLGGRLVYEFGIGVLSPGN
ncbi:MAG: hypothetical protein NZ473_06725 [Candidatus Kapabacteria bacterium]|nr:hypothetical protein [Candidatus Kapabacteria bacterium]MCS7169111.1 hypothetical protein [Candidatus Kapabacteria bacterium]MDW7997571.1 DUF2231 domain-containing protein [Bacteroidota bacterium]MDW8225985.1 DUF2231 domain-containing protein [Bacteroidota bacterium]